MSINSGERGVTTGVRQNNVWAEAAAIDKEQIDFPYPDSLLTQGQMTGGVRVPDEGGSAEPVQWPIIINIHLDFH